MFRPQSDLSNDRPENLMTLPNTAALAILDQMYGYYEFEAPVRTTEVSAPYDIAA